MRTFIDLCLHGEANPKDIDAIELWHMSNSILSLHEFLGMTWEEYRRWVEESNTLEDIIWTEKVK